MTYKDILRLYISNLKSTHTDSEIIPFKVIKYDFASDIPDIKMETEEGSVEIVYTHEESFEIKLRAIKTALIYVCKGDPENLDEYDISTCDMEFVENPDGSSRWKVDFSSEITLDLDLPVSHDIEEAAYVPFIGSKLYE